MDVCPLCLHLPDVSTAVCWSGEGLYLFAVQCLLIIACVFAQVSFHHVWLVSLLLAVLWGVFSSLVTLTPGHDSR